MSASLIPTDPTSDDAAPSSNKDGSVPSGFILKLYQMVNGAPDDVISVSSYNHWHLFFHGHLDLDTLTHLGLEMPNACEQEFTPCWINGMRFEFPCNGSFTGRARMVLKVLDRADCDSTCLSILFCDDFL